VFRRGTRLGCLPFRYSRPRNAETTLERALPANEVCSTSCGACREGLVSQVRCRDGPSPPLSPGLAGNPKVGRGHQERLPGARHGIKVARALSLRDEPQRPLEQVRELVGDHVGERGVRGSGGAQAHAGRVPELFRDAEVPRGRRQQVQLEVNLLEFRERGEVGTGDPRQGLAVAVVAETASDLHPVTASEPPAKKPSAGAGHCREEPPRMDQTTQSVSWGTEIQYPKPDTSSSELSARRRE